MTHKFCIHCGVKNSYQASPPNFCFGCGKPFNKAGSQQKVEVEEEYEDSVGNSKVADVDELSQGWGANVQAGQQVTFGDLFNNPTQKSNYRSSRPTPKGLDGDIVEKTIEECKPVRKSKELGS